MLLGVRVCAVIVGRSNGRGRRSNGVVRVLVLLGIDQRGVQFFSRLLRLRARLGVSMHTP